MTLIRAVTVKWLRQMADETDHSNWKEIGNGKYTQNFNELAVKKEQRNEKQWEL